MKSHQNEDNEWKMTICWAAEWKKEGEKEQPWWKWKDMGRRTSGVNIVEDNRRNMGVGEWYDQQQPQAYWKHVAIMKTGRRAWRRKEASEVWKMTIEWRMKEKHEGEEDSNVVCNNENDLLIWRMNEQTRREWNMKDNRSVSNTM